jgi:hypothetical protein
MPTILSQDSYRESMVPVISGHEDSPVYQKEEIEVYEMQARRVRISHDTSARKDNGV